MEHRDSTSSSQETHLNLKHSLQKPHFIEPRNTREHNKRLFQFQGLEDQETAAANPSVPFSQGHSLPKFFH